MEISLILEEITRQNKFWAREKQRDFFGNNTFKRELYPRLVALLTDRLIISIVGLRRVGKTVLLKQLIGHLIDNDKVEPRNILFLSFDEAMLSSAVKLDDYLRIYLSHFQARRTGRLYIFLDEIQYAPEWQHILKRFYDTEPNIKFIISGSSSLFLKKKATESLVGRIYEFNLPVLSFVEYLELAQVFSANLSIFKSLLCDIKAGSKDWLKLDVARKIFLSEHSLWLAGQFDEYLLRGQFPEVVGEKDIVKIERYLRESVYKKTIEFDIPRLFGADKVGDLKFIFQVLVNETGNQFEVGNLAQEAQIDQKTLTRYLSFFEESLLARILYNYSRSLRKTHRQPKKIYISSTNFYPLDLATPLETRGAILGHLAETHACNLLRARFDNLSFYRVRKQEVDFIGADNWLDRSSYRLIEVKYRSDVSRQRFVFLENTAKRFGVGRLPVVLTKYEFGVSEKLALVPLFMIK
ncbi:MAG: hypothetical protein A3J93_03680 [Candidatus Magasanikbacteria bacterium RIFOXYC2_FULL_42_28]|uniref:Uncharacterized protein n=1 Tax=Candidatus Magasanikbacteria bacterium RIFOXYC2_FULL_42_28 TaxID=1798704 RepID=A0A1F6NUQ1_9BACT|nr:MAG: hypothetical protein A3J93_03680 [Candidatus Magasanikbacteria bacterium RIFOXYC2_FULL_42_28]